MWFSKVPYPTNCWGGIRIIITIKYQQVPRACLSTEVPLTFLIVAEFDKEVASFILLVRFEPWTTVLSKEVVSWDSILISGLLSRLKEGSLGPFLDNSGLDDNYSIVCRVLSLLLLDYLVHEFPWWVRLSDKQDCFMPSLSSACRPVIEVLAEQRRPRDRISLFFRPVSSALMCRSHCEGQPPLLRVKCVLLEAVGSLGVKRRHKVNKFNLRQLI